MWRVCKEGGRSWPVICAEDPVIDYMVMEAVALRVFHADEKARKDSERKRKVDEERKRLLREHT